MLGVTGFFLSLTRLLQRPWALLACFVVLLTAAGLATIPTMSAMERQMAWQADPYWTPETADIPLLRDSVLFDGLTLTQTWTLAGLLVIAVILLFSFLDALMMLAAAAEWDGLVSAVGTVVRKAIPLTTLAVVAVVWIGMSTGLTHALLGPRIGDLARSLPSERTALWVEAIPDLLWLALVVPGWVGADLARARLVVGSGRSGFVSFLWGLSRSLTIAPWVAALVALLIDSAIVFTAAQLRGLWDPRTSASLFVALTLILAIMATRVVVHGAYVGAIGRIVHARTTASSE